MAAFLLGVNVTVNSGESLVHYKGVYLQDSVSLTNAAIYCSYTVWVDLDKG